MRSTAHRLIQAWHRNDRYREMLMIVVLLIATLIFGFYLIPLGINEGFGEIGPGLSPRFMPELATAGIALALAFGLACYLFIPSSQSDADIQSPDDDGHPLRAVAVISICLFFAAFGFRVAGFYLGGVAMAALLTFFLGERKLLNVVVIPILVLAVIYVVFEMGFQIRLPKSNLLPGVPI